MAIEDSVPPPPLPLPVPDREAPEACPDLAALGPVGTRLDFVRFGDSRLGERLLRERSLLDRLPFGAVLLDSGGVIVKYNAGEAAIAGRDFRGTVGQNFFDIAPCTRTPHFLGRFREGVAAGRINLLFEYVFSGLPGRPAVRVHMVSEDTARGIWLFVKRL